MRASSKDDGWEGMGGRARMTNAFLGRSVTSELEMTVWDPPREFGYISRQPDGPPLHNHRVFEPVPGGTRLRGTTEAVLRPGLPGMVDRVQEQALRRTYAQAMARLPDAARAAVWHVERLGGRVRHHNVPSLLEVWLPIDVVERSAEHSDVLMIRPARLVRPTAGSDNQVTPIFADGGDQLSPPGGSGLSAAARRATGWTAAAGPPAPPTGSRVSATPPA